MKRLGHPFFNGFRELLALTIPIVISLSTDNVMIFADRLFLSRYRPGEGELYLSASLTGGVMAFTLVAFFQLTAGYVNALVAQYYGAKQDKNCVKAVVQAFFFCLTAYPLILFLNPLVDFLFQNIGHGPQQVELEKLYTRILLWGSLISLLRTVLGNFFLGTGRSKIVMIANIGGMLLNIPLDYCLIYGYGPFPEKGIAGAALATVLGGTFSLLILLFVFCSERRNSRFRKYIRLRFNRPIFVKLLKYGIPAGIETLINISVINFFILGMSSYGSLVGAAIAITFNYEAMAFLPLLGLSSATTVTAGRFMGAGRPEKVKLLTKQTLLLGIGYTAFLIILFNAYGRSLIRPFIGETENPIKMMELSYIMLRLSTIYMLSDSVAFVFSGALRGAGDTRVLMIITVTIHLLFGIIIGVAVFLLKTPPLLVWNIFILFVIILGIAVTTRYRQGRWMHIKMIEKAPV